MFDCSHTSVLLSNILQFLEICPNVEDMSLIGLSTGRFWTQPKLNPLESNGTRTDSQLTANHPGSSQLSLSEQAVGSIEFVDERRWAEEKIYLRQSKLKPTIFN